MRKIDVRMRFEFRSFRSCGRGRIDWATDCRCFFRVLGSNGERGRKGGRGRGRGEEERPAVWKRGLRVMHVKKVGAFLHFPKKKKESKYRPPPVTFACGAGFFRTISTQVFDGQECQNFRLAEEYRTRKTKVCFCARQFCLWEINWLWFFPQGQTGPQGTTHALTLISPSILDRQTLSLSLSLSPSLSFLLLNSTYTRQQSWVGKLESKATFSSLRRDYRSTGVPPFR